jgi:hypothetical protein
LHSAFCILHHSRTKQLHNSKKIRFLHQLCTSFPEQDVHSSFFVPSRSASRTGAACGGVGCTGATGGGRLRKAHIPEINHALLIKIQLKQIKTS